MRVMGSWHGRLGPGLLAAVLGGVACSGGAPSPPPPAASANAAGEFLRRVNDTMLRLASEQQRAAWVAATHITLDTQTISARANQAFIEAVASNAKEATRFDGVTLSPEARRQLDLLKIALVTVTPSDPKEAEVLTRLTAAMEGA